MELGIPAQQHNEQAQSRGELQTAGDLLQRRRSWVNSRVKGEGKFPQQEVGAEEQASGRQKKINREKV